MVKYKIVYICTYMYWMLLLVVPSSQKTLFIFVRYNFDLIFWLKYCPYKNLSGFFLPTWRLIKLTHQLRKLLIHQDRLAAAWMREQC
jgi:hypothetical protein